MSRTHLVSVGTSLLRNAARDLKRTPGDTDLDNYLAHTAPSTVSAENNALERELASGDRIVFFYSATDDGARCAGALCRHYRRAGYETEAIEVPELRVERGFERGLRHFVHLLSARIVDERRAGRAVLINATGGFKAQTGLATLVGVLHRVPVYYIFETQAHNVRLPALPLAWDASFAAAYGDVLPWLTEPRSRAEIEPRVAGRPDQEAFWSLLAEQEDGRFELSAAGYAVADVEPEVPGESDEIEQVRRLLAGRTLVLVGGEARPEAIQRLEAAFEAPVHWEETRAHQPPAPFATLVSRPDVAVVCLLIRLSDHAFGPALRELCRTHGTYYIALPGGYNPSEVAHQILVQAGERMRRGG